MPYSANSALASLSFALARSTNMDRRLSVAGSRSRLHTSRISSGPRLKPMKLACMRPLAVAEGGQPGLAGAEQGEVLGQLAVEEAGGIGALRADHAEVGQGCDAVQWRLMPELSWPHQIAMDEQGGPPLSEELCSCWPCWPRWPSAAPAGGGCTSRCGCCRARWTCRSSRAPAARRWRRPSATPASTSTRDLLYAWFRLSGEGRLIKAGSYELEKGITPLSACWTSWPAARNRCAP
jgi:hypothetical protein